MWLSHSVQRRISRRSSSDFGAEVAVALGEVVEDDAGLGEPELAVLEDRHLAHLVELEVLGGAGGAVEEVDPHRLPVGVVEGEHQRDLVGVAGLGEAVELVFGHQNASSGRAITGSAPDRMRARWSAVAGSCRAM